jgi:uncharacterized protein YebE (UPF0316 family)
MIDPNSDAYTLFLVPILIFLAKVGDVSFGTIRIIMISRGMKYFAPIFGFLEITIWLFAISQIMQHLNSISYYFAYAIGYSAGTYVGILIEEKMALGRVIIRIITKKDAMELTERLRSTGYGVTSFDGQGSTGVVRLIYMTVERKDVDDILEIIKKFNPKAFFSIEGIRSANEGVFPLRKDRHWSFDLEHVTIVNREFVNNLIQKTIAKREKLKHVSIEKIVKRCVVKHEDKCGKT